MTECQKQRKMTKLQSKTSSYTDETWPTVIHWIYLFYIFLTFEAKPIKCF